MIRQRASKQIDQKGRYLAMVLFVLLLFGILLFQLTRLQIEMGEEYAAAFEDGSTRTLRIPGTRGMILDQSGVPLAYDEVSYNITFTRDPGKRSKEATANYTQVLRDTIAIIEGSGGKTEQNFGIRQNEAGGFEFYWGNISEEAAARREARWRGYMRIDEETSAEDAYWELRERYYLPEDMTYEEAFKVLSLWQDVQEISYMSYRAITVASDVSLEAVTAISMRAQQLEGMEVTQSTSRVYPKGTLAAHVIGYMGRMSDEETIAAYEELGYSSTDYIGIAGLEATMESQLSGNTTERSGSRTVVVSSLGKAINEVTEAYVEPGSGNNVITTIDVNLQAVTDEALASAIAAVREEQQEEYSEHQASYDEQVEKRGGNAIELVSYGAAIVMDCRTAKVLAMSSAPGFDPNIFVGGLSTEDYAKVSDSTTTPLLNKAIATRGTPGSIFKMATGLAGLMEGVITTETEISDAGEFRKHITSATAKGPSCWIKSGYLKHSDQTLSDALKNSCNYFFYDISYKMGIDALVKWAGALGLSSTTGIELPGEVSSQLASAETLYDPDKSPTGISALVYNNIYDLLVTACEEEGLFFDKERFDSVTLELMEMAVDSDTSEYGSDARALLRSELELPMSRITAGLFAEISAQLNQIIWNANHTIVASIGQSVSLQTPISVARYLSALVNGGNVYQASVLDSVVSPEGRVVEKYDPVLVNSLDIPEAYTEAIKEGMRDVVSPEEGGTASSYFAGWKYINEIGGKTGTAQVSTIDLEDNSWFVAFAPYDEPEIAVVIYIAHGYKGGLSAPAAKSIIEYYLDSKQDEGSTAVLPGDHELIP